MLVVAREKISSQSTAICGRDEADGPIPGPQSHPGVKVSHTRSKSAPSSRPKEMIQITDTASEINGRNENDLEVEKGELDGINDLGVKSASLKELETPTASLEYTDQLTLGCNTANCKLILRKREKASV